MGEIVAFEEFKKSAGQSEILALFRRQPPARAKTAGRRERARFPSSRTGISGNLGDLFEQANAVVMRHSDGDVRVPRAVAEKCLELLMLLANEAEPE
jgi:hypothetical protein